MQPKERPALGMPAKVKLAEQTLVQVSLYLPRNELQEALSKNPVLQRNSFLKPFLDKDDSTINFGTGFFVNDSGDAITADHVIRDLHNVKMELETLGFHPRAQLELPRTSSEKNGLLGVIVQLLNGPGGIAKAVQTSYVTDFLTKNRIRFQTSSQ